MQSLSQLLPVTETGLALTMFIYQPNQYSCDRVVWHGGESTQLHYEQEAIQNGHPIWKEVFVQTPMEFPTSMSELHEKMIALYNDQQFWDEDEISSAEKYACDHYNEQFVCNVW